MDNLPTELCNHLSFLVFGLLTQCPHGKPLASCPLGRFRNHGSLEEKFRLAKQLSERESDQVLAGHNRCFRGRLQSLRTFLAKGLATDPLDEPLSQPGMDGGVTTTD